MNCDYECIVNDDYELKLTKEYKYLLSYIRPFIDQLEKSRDVQLCLLWLSKLEQSATWEKDYRNKILSELCKQVKSNCLKAPFNSSPPNGPLRNIICEDHKAMDCVFNECSEGYISPEEFFSSSSLQSFPPLKSMGKRQSNSEFWTGGCNNAYHERAQSDQVVIEKYQEIIKCLVSQKFKGDMSPNKFKKLQSTYEVKIVELLENLKKEQEENGLLRRKLHCLERNLKNWDVLRSDNESLRKKIAELEDEKSCLDSKYQKAEDERIKSLSELINKLNESEKKLKDSEKRYKSLEKVYENNYCSFESQCQAKVNEREKQYRAELTTLEKLLDEKQKEVHDLKQQLKKQSERFEEQISHLQQKLEETPNLEKEKEKVRNLKIKARKLEKVREHMTVLFQSQLQQILAKKDFYIASLEMQLRMNNSESGPNAFNSELNNSIDQRISTLEAQYRKLLEDSERQSMKRRHLDLQKIHTLQKQLLSYGEVVVDNEPKNDETKADLIPPESACEVSPKSGKA